MATNELSLSMKLLIDGKTQKVCFAEASNDVVEFLSSLLCPVSTVIKLLSKERMVGSIGNVLDSLEKLDAKYVLPNRSKEPYLSPANPPVRICPSQRLLGEQLNATTVLFTCQRFNMSFNTSFNTGFTHYSCGKFSATKDSICPSCSTPMNNVMQHVETIGSGEFLVATATYTVKDDLSMAPASSMSSVTLLAQCGVKDLSTLEEKTVKIGKEEALEILLASFKSKTVLTDVFLQKKNVRCKRETTT